MANNTDWYPGKRENALSLAKSAETRTSVVNRQCRTASRGLKHQLCLSEFCKVWLPEPEY